MFLVESPGVKLVANLGLRAFARLLLFIYLFYATLFEYVILENRSIVFYEVMCAEEGERSSECILFPVAT